MRNLIFETPDQALVIMARELVSLITLTVNAKYITIHESDRALFIYYSAFIHRVYQVFVKGVYGGTFGEVFVEPKFSLADTSHLMFLSPAATFQTAQ